MGECNKQTIFLAVVKFRVVSLEVLTLCYAGYEFMYPVGFFAKLLLFFSIFKVLYAYFYTFLAETKIFGKVSIVGNTKHLEVIPISIYL